MTTLDNRPNSALLVIDVQNGVVGNALHRDATVANIGTLVDKARAADVISGPIAETVGYRASVMSSEPGCH